MDAAVDCAKVSGMVADPSLAHAPLSTWLAALRAAKESLHHRYGVRSLGVFGSHVRDEARPDNDLDILVEFDSPPTLFEYVRLQNDLSELLGVRADLVMRSALKPDIGEQIPREVVEV
jgi:predicted nucleotidyltransferase